MPVKTGIRVKAEKTIASAGLDSLRSERVPYDVIWCVQNTAWEISKATSGGNTRCRLYIEGPGWKHYIEEQQSPAADNLYTYSYPIWLHPLERLCVEIDQAQASTIAKLYMTGYREELKGGRKLEGGENV